MAPVGRLQMQKVEAMTLCSADRRHHHHPSHQLVYRAATKPLHTCLSLASLWMVPQLWFIDFISASITVLHQVVFHRPRFHFPSWVQWMYSTELQSNCDNPRFNLTWSKKNIYILWNPCFKKTEKNPAKK